MQRSSLDPALQLSQRGCHDASLRPALDEAGKRNPQLDVEVVDDFGVVTARLERVGALVAGREVAVLLLPGQLAGRAGVVVRQRQRRAAPEGGDAERDLGRSSVRIPLEDADLLD